MPLPSEIPPLVALVMIGFAMFLIAMAMIGLADVLDRPGVKRWLASVLRRILAPFTRQR